MVDLTETEALVYAWLYRHKERPSVVRLAKILNINRMAVSRALATLEELGAIKARHIQRRNRQIFMPSLEVVMTPEELQERLRETSPLTKQFPE